MHIYALTLQRATGITHAVSGNFSDVPRSYEIIVARGKILELLRPDDQGRLQTVYSTEVFGLVRDIIPFRLTGAGFDYIAVASDSGKISILKYNRLKNCFDRIHEETFGRSGCRRVIPGQYIASDPRGRALLIAAVEKQRFVYVLNRDSSNSLTISSPLEAHRGHTILTAIVGLDVHFDNPLFAALEYNYDEDKADPTKMLGPMQCGPAEKTLTYYELDLGLNHVVWKDADKVEASAHRLLQVPGGSDGPGGAIVCFEGFVEHRNIKGNPVRCYFPRRTTDDPTLRGPIVVANVLVKKKNFFFFLIQTELGDLFKLSLSYESNVVSTLEIKYFDTVPPGISLAFLRNGCLFVAAESGNHSFYQFSSIGEDVEPATVFSTNPPAIREGSIDQHVRDCPAFSPLPLRNLVLLDEIDNYSPVCDAMMTEDHRLIVACGRGPRSSIRVVRPGLSVNEMAVAPLPQAATGVWTVRRNIRDEFDSWIVVSMVQTTLVLQIGENVEEVVAETSGLMADTKTLGVSLLGENMIVQVHPEGMRMVTITAEGNSIAEWQTTSKQSVVRCSCNAQQLLLGLSGGEVVYFELSPEGVMKEIARTSVGADVSCLAIPPIPENRRRAPFCAVGVWDTVKILSLDPKRLLEAVAIQALPATQAESLVMSFIPVGTGDAVQSVLFLNVGLYNGVLLRSVVDIRTGKLSDQRLRLCGKDPVGCFAVSLNGNPAVLALSSKPWLAYPHAGQFALAPLSYTSVGAAAKFSSEQCPDGLVAVASDTLRIISLPVLGDSFNSRSFPLLHTPRKFAMHPTIPSLIFIVETDAGTPHPHSAAVSGDQKDQDAMDQNQENVAGLAPMTRWTSALHVFNSMTGETVHYEQMEPDIAVLSVVPVLFVTVPRGGQPGVLYVVAGIVKDFDPTTGSFSYAAIRTYACAADGSLHFIHDTPVDGLVYGLAPFYGKLLVGVGKALRLYDMGTKKLLRKCENKLFHSQIVKIIAQSGTDRIVVADAQRGIIFVKYHAQDNQLYMFADEAIPRAITAAAVLDYDTVVASDKFGNVFSVRIPAEVSRELETDPTGAKYSWDATKPTGARSVLKNLFNYHVGDISMALSRGVVTPGGQESILMVTFLGSLTVCIPFTSREDIDFFTHLEMHMRQESKPLLGRDHLAFRSYFVPVKDVVDGDLCEKFAELGDEKQRAISEDLGRTPAEIIKKLEDLRNRV